MAAAIAFDAQAGDLAAYLRANLEVFDRCGEVGDPTRYAVAWADLNGDGRREAIVLLSGGGWCGSGGCQMLVLEERANGFVPRANTTVTRAPIKVLESRTKGWRDLSVFVAGGGVIPGYDARLQFDGRDYGSNPTTVDKVLPSARGRVLLTRQAQTIALYPPAPIPTRPSDLPSPAYSVNGRRIEITLPDAHQQCWHWQAVSLDREIRQVFPAPRLTGFEIWSYDAPGRGDYRFEYVLLPSWRFIYGEAEQRAAAAQTYAVVVSVN